MILLKKGIIPSDFLRFSIVPVITFVFIAIVYFPYRFLSDIRIVRLFSSDDGYFLGKVNNWSILIFVDFNGSIIRICLFIRIMTSCLPCFFIVPIITFVFSTVKRFPFILCRFRIFFFSY